MTIGTILRDLTLVAAGWALGVMVQTVIAAVRRQRSLDRRLREAREPVPCGIILPAFSSTGMEQLLSGLRTERHIHIQDVPQGSLREALEDASNTGLRKAIAEGANVLCDSNASQEAVDAAAAAIERALKPKGGA